MRLGRRPSRLPRSSRGSHLRVTVLMVKSDNVEKDHSAGLAAAAAAARSAAMRRSTIRTDQTEPS